MGYLIIFNAAAAEFVGLPLLRLHCTGLLQPSNSYYSMNHDVVGILVPNNKLLLTTPSKTCIKERWPYRTSSSLSLR